MPKIKQIILEEADTEMLIPKLIEFGRTAKEIKRYYPSVWAAISKQFSLDWIGDRSVSEGLFEKTLEIMLLQDDELRKK